MTSVVYFLRGEETGAIKIGFSKSLSTRLSNILTSSSEVVSLIGAVQGNAILEQSLHHEFSSDRIRREWFKSSDRLLARISSLLAVGAIEVSGIVRPSLPPTDEYTERAVKWIVAIENGEFERHGRNRGVTRKTIATRLGWSSTAIENLRYGRKRNPISVRDYEALRAIYVAELEAQASELKEIIKIHLPVVEAIAAETQLAAAHRILRGET